MVKKGNPEGDAQSDQAVKERLTSQIKAISLFLEQEGYTVRREELKRGLGWRASSGVCRTVESKLVFVDRRATLTEQSSFLVETLRSVVASEPSKFQRLPENLRTLIGGEAVSEAPLFHSPV